MADHAGTPGGAVLRSAPWAVVLPFAAGAVVVFATAIAARQDALGLLLALVGIGLCGGVSGYALDEEAVEVADASPTSRPRRAAWRIAIALLPLAVATTALVQIDRLA